MLKKKFNEIMCITVGSSRVSERHLEPGDDMEGEGQDTTWRHSHSGLMSSLAVTVTTFNISRFAVLGARFGCK